MRKSKRCQKYLQSEILFNCYTLYSCLGNKYAGYSHIYAYF